MACVGDVWDFRTSVLRHNACQDMHFFNTTNGVSSLARRRLDAVPAQHQKMRRKALRLLLRHTDAAVEELRDDDDEMLRGGFLPLASSLLQDACCPALLRHTDAASEELRHNADDDMLRGGSLFGILIFIGWGSQIMTQRVGWGDGAMTPITEMLRGGYGVLDLKCQRSRSVVLRLCCWLLWQRRGGGRRLHDVAVAAGVACT